VLIVINLCEATYCNISYYRSYWHLIPFALNGLLRTPLFCGFSTGDISRDYRTGLVPSQRERSCNLRGGFEIAQHARKALLVCVVIFPVPEVADIAIRT